jgi:predicted nucleotidyltransferase
MNATSNAETPRRDPGEVRGDGSVVILRGVVGSTAYGLATADSDIDRLGIYQARTVDVLGLDGAAATAGSQVTNSPDVTLHELGKYASLALKSNPTVLELLFLPGYDRCTPAGQALVDIRRCFPSTAAVRNSYGGYAYAQANRLLTRHSEGKAGFESSTVGRTAKHGRHCLRLLYQGIQLLTTGTLDVDVSAVRDELFAAGRLAETDPDAFHDLFRGRLSDLTAVRSVLPDHPDRDAVNATVTSLRLAQLNIPDPDGQTPTATPHGR